MKALLLIESEKRLEFKRMPITRLDSELNEHPNSSCFFPSSPFEEWNKVLEIGISKPKKVVYLNEFDVRLAIDDFLDRNVGTFQSFLEKLDDPEERNVILTQICLFVPVPQTKLERLFQIHPVLREFLGGYTVYRECKLKTKVQSFIFEWKNELGNISNLPETEESGTKNTKGFETETKKEAENPETEAEETEAVKTETEAETEAEKQAEKQEMPGPVKEGPKNPGMIGPPGMPRPAKDWKNWISESFGDSDNQKLVFQEGASFYYLIRPTEIKYRILQAGEIRREDSWSKTLVVPQKVTSFIKTEFGTMLRSLKVEISQPSDSYAQVRIVAIGRKIMAKPIAKPSPVPRASRSPVKRQDVTITRGTNSCGTGMCEMATCSPEGTSEFFKDLKKKNIVPGKHEAVVMKINAETVVFSGNGENRVFGITNLKNPNNLSQEIWKNARVIDSHLDPKIKWIWRDEPSDWSLKDIYPRVRGKDFTVVIASPLHPEKYPTALIQCDYRVFVCNGPDGKWYHIWETLDTMFPGRETQSIGSGFENRVTYKISQKCRDLMTQMNKSGVTNQQLTTKTMVLIPSSRGTRLTFGTFNHPVPKDTTLQEFQCIAELMDGPFQYLPRYIPGDAYSVNELTFEVDVFHSDPNAWHFEGLTRVRTEKTDDQLTFALTPDSGTMNDSEMEMMTRMLQQRYLHQAWVHTEVLSRKSKTYRLVFVRIQGNSLI